MKKLFLILFLLLLMVSVAYSQFFNSGSGAGGIGDMTKAVYDADGNSKIDAAAIDSLALVYQPLDTDLTYLSGFTPSNNVKSIWNAADFATIRTSMGLVIGTNVQAYDADLTTYAGITPSANAQTLLGETFAQMLASIGAQAADADLTTYAGITPSANAQTLLAETFAQMQASLSIDDLITLSGVAEGSAHLGTFTGATIADNVTNKAALQALETALELKQAGDGDLTTIAALAPADGKFIISSAAPAWSLSAYTLPASIADNDVLVGTGVNIVGVVSQGAAVAGVLGWNAAGTLDKYTSMSFDNTAAQFYDSVAPTKLVGIDPVSMTAGVTAWYKPVASTGPTYFTNNTVTAGTYKYGLLEVAGTWSGQQTFVAPILGAATATSLLATGIVDGTAPNIITATSADYAVGVTYKSGYVYISPTSASGPNSAVLPAVAEGLQYCIGNDSAKTGTLTVKTKTGVGVQYIDLDGVLTANTGHIQATAAAGNFACFEGMSSTVWKSIPTKGTWTAD